MARFRVLMLWTDKSGDYKPGDEVDLPDPETPAAQVDRDRLIDYGVIEPVNKEATSEPKKK